MKPGPQAESVVRAFNECINARDLEGLSGLMAPNHTFVDSAGMRIAGKEACVRAWEGFFRAFPDYRNVFDTIVARADGVAVIGQSRCADPRLDGPALWSAVVTDGHVLEWRVHEDTPANRRLLRLDENFAPEH